MGISPTGRQLFVNGDYFIFAADVAAFDQIMKNLLTISLEEPPCLQYLVE